MIMKRVIASLFFLFFSVLIFAQSGEIKVFDGKVVEGSLYMEKAFMLPQFTDGKVKLTNGEVFEGKVNIHALTQSIRFIGDKGDTLALDDDSIVSSVSAGNYFFIKDKRFYVQILNTDGNVSLGLTRTITLGSEVLEGAYGGKNEVSSIQKVNVHVSENKLQHIKNGSVLRFDYRENIYLVKDSRLYVPTKKNFVKFFPSKKDFVEEQFGSGKVSVSKEKELIVLFNQLVSM